MDVPILLFAKYLSTFGRILTMYLDCALSLISRSKTSDSAVNLATFSSVYIISLTTTDFTFIHVTLINHPCECFEQSLEPVVR